MLEYFDLLRKESTALNLLDKASNIYSAEESWFTCDNVTKKIFGWKCSEVYVERKRFHSELSEGFLMGQRFFWLNLGG